MPELKRGNDYFAGLDVLRLGAIGLVTIEHIFSLFDHNEWTKVGGLSIGQTGVALFFAISGLLAAESRRPPVQWLMQRLSRLYPAYWIAISASFALAWVANHKPFDLWQVIAQFAGIGLFTHGSRLINTPTWFVSLLLVCYVGTFVTRLVRAPLLIGMCGSLCLAIYVATVPNTWLSSHMLTYALASSFALTESKIRTKLTFAVAFVLFVIAALFHVNFCQSAIALTAVELSLFLRSVPRPIRMAANYVYEYYLVHGPVLYGMIRWVQPHPYFAVVGGIALAALTAVILHRTVEIGRRLAKVPRASEANRTIA